MTSENPPNGYSAQAPQEETVSLSTMPSTAETPPATPAPGAGAGVLTAVTALWVSLGSIWKGKPVDAFRLGTATKNFWLVGFLIYSLIVGLLTATLAARSIGSADALLGSMSSSLIGYNSRGTFGLSAGDWISLLLVGLVLGFVAFLFRALCLKWTFAVRGVSQSLGTACNIITTSYIVQMTILLAATILLMIPSAAISGLVLLLVGLVSVPLSVISEVLIYIGLNRTARFDKSALIPHALFTGIWMAMTLVAYLIMASVFLENIL